MKFSILGKELVFVDVEASSLDKGSFPVEVGWAIDDEAAESMLVLPHADWDTVFGWSPISQTIHGITLEQLLAEGVDVDTVCDRLDLAFGGRVPVSDNPTWDDYWFAMLYEAARRVRQWTVGDLAMAYSVLAFENRLKATEAHAAFHDVERRWPHPHRAAPDAQRMAKRARALADEEFRLSILAD